MPVLLGLVEPDERGDPVSPLRWTTQSLRSLAGELTRQGHPVSAPTVNRLLREHGFSLQARSSSAAAEPRRADHAVTALHVCATPIMGPVGKPPCRTQLSAGYYDRRPPSVASPSTAPVWYAGPHIPSGSETGPEVSCPGVNPVLGQRRST